MSAAVLRLVPAPELAEQGGLGRRLDHMLKIADAHPDDGVCVAGPGAGDAMCALWHRGYERVEAARRVTCHCADTDCKLLLVIGIETSDQALKIIEAVSPILMPGGRLVIDANGLASVAERLRLCNLLAHRGFCYHPKAHLEVALLATKPYPENLQNAG